MKVACCTVDGNNSLSGCERLKKSKDWETVNWTPSIEPTVFSVRITFTCNRSYL